MSAAFAAIGLFSAYWVYSRTSNIELASGIFFFFTMEFLQAIQYYFIAPELKGNVDGTCPTVDSKYYDEVSPCDTVTNKVLTLLGFLHICLQPYYCHVINASLTKSCKNKGNSVFLFHYFILSFVLFQIATISSSAFVSSVDFCCSFDTFYLSSHPSTLWIWRKKSLLSGCEEDICVLLKTRIWFILDGLFRWRILVITSWALQFTHSSCLPRFLHSMKRKEWFCKVWSSSSLVQ